MVATADLAELGADHVIPETVESSLQLAAQLLAGLGFPAYTVGDLIDQIRNSEYAAFHRVIEADDDAKSSAASHEGDA